MIGPRAKLRLLGIVAFAAATVPFAIGAHLISEVAALGSVNSLDVVFSTRHLYFIGIALVALGALRVIAARFEGPSKAARVEELLRALPFGGRGARFGALTFAVQLAFFVTTQVLEGCPVSGGDVVAGLVTAVLAAAFGSLLLAFFERRIIAFALATWLGAKPAHALASHSQRRSAVRFSGRRGAFLFSIANRPPPAAAAI